MKKQFLQKHVLKLTTTELKAEKWNYKINVEKALTEEDDRIVALGSSQCLRWIDMLNGNEDTELIGRQIKSKIKALMRGDEEANRQEILRQRVRLKQLLFTEDYLLVKVDKKTDYDRANRGFTVNGVKYRRLLGTSGGIKMSTIVYVSERIYPKIKERMDNNRDMQMKLVPAKLEAYQALICSASIPVPMPKGIIVVPDCITYFKDDVIVLDDSCDGEPSLKEVNDYPIEHNGSDGFGLMTPEYAKKVAKRLEFSDEPISGFTCRYAWTKGMLYTFDFVEFAEKKAGKFTVTDVWGQERDVREAEVILTESMLKLWSGYKSMEEFLEYSKQNGYEFAATKTTDYVLDTAREMNYQFLQSYDFTDDEIEELCQPTVDTINAVLGGNVDLLKAYLMNFSYVNTEILRDGVENWVKALMVSDEVMKDPYLIRRILSMTERWCDSAKRGRILVDGSFIPISGDPYALCESMFGMEVHGLLWTGEIYHRYWSDHGATEVVCFRAPMTCHNNIRKVRLNDSEECRYWYRYMPSVSIQNNWDTMCDAMNGSDFDGDTNFVTDNPVLLRNTRNDKTIVCLQKQAEKTIPKEKDIIKANKIGFSDAIGTITNYITAMFEVRSAYNINSPEYKELSYRIMAGQGYQQGSIDAIKGIVAKPMPDYWHDLRKCRPSDKNGFSDAESEWQKKLCAYRKPYFMTYVYSKVKQDYRRHIENYNNTAAFLYYNLGIRDIQDLIAYEPKDDQMREIVSNYEKYIPVGRNECTVNRITYHLEKEIKPARTLYQNTGKDFDYSLYKSRIEHEKSTNRAKLSEIIRKCSGKHSQSIADSEQDDYSKVAFVRLKCLEICPDINLLVDTVLDLTYGRGKSQIFAWNVFGDIMLENLIKNTGCTHYKMPIRDKNGEIEFKGKRYRMDEVAVETENEVEIKEDDNSDDHH